MKLFVFTTLAFLAALFLFDHFKESPPAKQSAKESPAIVIQAKAKPAIEQEPSIVKTAEIVPSFDRLDQLFKPDSSFPFMETLTYKAKVSWLKGRSAWVNDYAHHFQTSRFFIARSLGVEEAKEGDPFNVFSLDYPFHFHLLLDLSKKKLWFAVVDDKNDTVHWLKDYTVCIGREDITRPSGYLTPTGTYSLGDRIAVYAPESKGYYHGERVEMIRHFGTRWIPFEKEVKNCSAPAKSYGIHGVPWNKELGDWQEDCSSLGTPASDGCIRLKTSDVEELYSIITSRPLTTTIEITHDYAKADLKP